MDTTTTRMYSVDTKLGIRHLYHLTSEPTVPTMSLLIHI